MAPRLELQTKLETLLGSRNVYFQPPSELVMQYPAIVYHRSNIEPDHAGNLPYRLTNRYTVTIIDRRPDSSVVDLMATWPTCRHERQYKVTGLNHDVFNLYF